LIGLDMHMRRCRQSEGRRKRRKRMRKGAREKSLGDDPLVGGDVEPCPNKKGDGEEQEWEIRIGVWHRGENR